MVLGLAGLFVALFLSFPHWIRDLLVDPALRLFLFLDSLPQGLVWVLVLVVVAFLGLRMLQFFPNEPRSKARKGRTPEVLPGRELVVLLRRVSYSPWARRALRHRLARILVALRTEREPVSASQIWQELRSGRWPGDNALGRFLRGEEAPDFQTALTKALDELWRYAEGGEL